MIKKLNNLIINPSLICQKGQNVFLKKPTKSDFNVFVKSMKASKKLHRKWVTPPCTIEKYEKYLKRIRSEKNEGFFICLRSNNALVGVINCNEIIRGALQSCFLGYYATSSYSGQGYMTEGLKLLLKHAFRIMKLNRLEANIQPENTKSIELVKRCGFRLEGFSPHYLKIAGRWQDHERWAISKQDWIQNKIN